MRAAGSEALSSLGITEEQQKYDELLVILQSTVSHDYYI